MCFRLCVRAKIPVHACRAVKVTEIERKHETGKLGKIFLFVLAAVVSESRESIRKEKKEREKLATPVHCIIFYSTRGSRIAGLLLWSGSPTPAATDVVLIDAVAG